MATTEKQAMKAANKYMSDMLKMHAAYGTLTEKVRRAIFKNAVHMVKLLTEKV